MFLGLLVCLFVHMTTAGRFLVLGFIMHPIKCMCDECSCKMLSLLLRNNGFGAHFIMTTTAFSELDNIIKLQIDHNEIALKDLKMHHIAWKRS